MNYSLDSEIFALFKGLNVDEDKVANFARKLNELLLNSDKETKEKVENEVKILGSTLKDELKNELTTKQDLEIVKLELQKDIKESESKLIKWSFLFWISQMGVILGMGFMIMKSLEKI